MSTFQDGGKTTQGRRYKLQEVKSSEDLQDYYQCQQEAAPHQWEETYHERHKFLLGILTIFQHL